MTDQTGDILERLRGIREAIDADERDRAVEQLEDLRDTGDLEVESLNSQIEQLREGGEPAGIRQWLENVIGQVENWGIDPEEALESAQIPEANTGETMPPPAGHDPTGDVAGDEESEPTGEEGHREADAADAAPGIGAAAESSASDVSGDDEGGEGGFEMVESPNEAGTEADEQGEEERDREPTPMAHGESAAQFGAVESEESGAEESTSLEEEDAPEETGDKEPEKLEGAFLTDDRSSPQSFDFGDESVSDIEFSVVDEDSGMFHESTGAEVGTGELDDEGEQKAGMDTDEGRPVASPSPDTEPEDSGEETPAPKSPGGSNLEAATEASGASEEGDQSGEAPVDEAPGSSSLQSLGASFDEEETSGDGIPEDDGYGEDDKTAKFDVSEDEIPGFGGGEEDGVGPPGGVSDGDQEPTPFAEQESDAEEFGADTGQILEPEDVDEDSDEPGTRMGWSGGGEEALDDLADDRQVGDQEHSSAQESDDETGASEPDDEDIDLGFENPGGDDDAGVSLDPEPGADQDDAASGGEPADSSEEEKEDDEFDLGFENPGDEDSAGVALDPTTDESSTGESWEGEEAGDEDSVDSTFYGMPTGEQEVPEEEGEGDDEESVDSTFYGMPAGEENRDDVQTAAEVEEDEPTDVAAEQEAEEDEDEGDEGFSLGELEDQAKTDDEGSDPFEFDFNDDEETELAPSDEGVVESEDVSAEEERGDDEGELGARYSVTEDEPSPSEPRFEEPSVSESVSDPNQTPQPEDDHVDDERFFELAEELAGEPSAEEATSAEVASEETSPAPERQRHDTEEAPDLSSPGDSSGNEFQEREKTDEAPPIEQQADEASDERERESTQEAPTVSQPAPGQDADRHRRVTAEATEASSAEALDDASQSGTPEAGLVDESSVVSEGSDEPGGPASAGVVDGSVGEEPSGAAVVSEPEDTERDSDSSGEGALADFVNQEDEASGGGSQSGGSEGLDSASMRLLEEAKGLLEKGNAESARDLVQSVLAREPGNSHAESLLEKIDEATAEEEPQDPEERLGSLEGKPERVLSMDEVADRDLDHRFGFVLSLVDGTVSFEDILDLSSMPRDETLEVLAEMCDRDIISVD